MTDAHAKTDSPFRGPLFIVGMPRSGTKLLRGLLNQHPCIGIPNVESQFLPYWVKNQARFGDLSQSENFSLFYQQATNLPYFVYMEEERGIIKEDDWRDTCTRYDIAGVFEALIRHDARVPLNSQRIWGDKTPSYLIHIPLLKTLYPAARIIHIVRDVRDYSLSNKAAWGKNMIRATVRWVERLDAFQDHLKMYTDNLLELRYEDLLENPMTHLRQICDFLDLNFDEQMLQLSTPSENIGSAKDAKVILKNNKQKYLKDMSPRTCRQIEAIARPLLEKYGYPVEYNGPIESVSRIWLHFYQLLDGINLVIFEARKRGIVRALRFRWKLFYTSGNRS